MGTRIEKVRRSYKSSAYTNGVTKTYGGGLETFTFDYKNMKGLIAWTSPRQQKPQMMKLYPNYDDRMEAIQSIRRQIAQEMEAKIEAREKAAKIKQEAMQGISVGDIYYSSWGYEQTNVNFYKVVAIKGMSVSLVEVGSRDVSQDQDGSQVTADTRDERGEVFTRRINKYGTFRISSVQRGSKWDGLPKSQTSYYAGH